MKKAHRSLIVLVLIVLVVGLLLASPAPAPAQAPNSRTVVRFYFRDQQHLDAVAGELDIWEVHRDEGYAVASIRATEAGWLEGLGYELHVDAEKTATLGIQAPLDPRFHYYDDFFGNSYGRYVKSFLEDIAYAYSDLTQLYDAGDAWQSAHGGHARDMWVLRITNEDPAYGDIASKPAFFLHANVHAREVTTPEMAIRYVKYLLQGYNSQGGYNQDPDATWLVNHNVAYVMVMANPDGHWVNETDSGANRRKNMDNDDGCSDPYSWGVDLNRNHTFKWGCCNGSSGNPCSDTYRGPTKGSEPETQAFQTFFTSVMLDQNGNNGDDEIPPAAPDAATGTMLSLHTYADQVLWPWGWTTSQPPNYSQLRTIGRKLGYLSTYAPDGFLYTVDGDTHDWTYGKFGLASFTFEIGPDYGSCAGFFPAYGCMDGIDGMPRNFWSENRPAFLYLHKIADTPYITAYGPDAQNVAVNPASVPQGIPVDLTANLADHRYSGDPLQPVAAAEYFLDAPGADGTGTPLAPSDGGWGGTNENGEATLDTAGWAVGRHYVLVHARGNNGKWGPFSAVFVDIEPGVANTMHVNAMKMRYATRLGGRYAVSAAVRLVDQNGQAVPGATVSGQWTLPDGAQPTVQEAVTNMRGIAVFKTKSTQVGIYGVCVTGALKPGYFYDPSQNLITCKTLNVP